MKTESKEPEQEEGTLDRIRYQNDSGFIIGEFTDKHNNKFSGLGNMINPQVSLGYLMTGVWEENSKFGDQFKFSAYETILPVDNNGIFKYVVRICKFVGSSVGNAIINKYGDKTLLIMKGDPDRLAKEISGITLDRAKEIQKALMENEENEHVMIELEAMFDIPGMRKNLSAELVKIYKSNAAEMVKENPYILTRFRGIGFPLADRVALNIGFKRDSIFRKEAAALHVIGENMQAGSLWIYKDDLIIKIKELIQVPELAKGLDSLLDQGIVTEDNKNYALMGPAIDESLIAKLIVDLVAA